MTRHLTSQDTAALRAAVERALRAHPDCSLIIGGGVAANAPLRAAMAEVAAVERRTVVVPPLKWCTDNAAMIAAAGLRRLRGGHVSDLTFNADAALSL